jgi:hypothetical protein
MEEGDGDRREKVLAAHLPSESSYDPQRYSSSSKRIGHAGSTREVKQ